MPTRCVNRIRKQHTFEVLHAQIEAGVQALEKGEFAEVADADLNDYIESLANTVASKCLR